MGLTSNIVGAALLILAADAARVVPKNNLLAPASVPSWACAFPKNEADLKSPEEAAPTFGLHLHRLFVTGNASYDEANAAAIEKAAVGVEKEDSEKAKSFVNQADAKAAEAKEEAKKASELDAKAKSEVEKNATAAQKDSQEALDEAKLAMNASATAQRLTEDAVAMEKVAQIESTQMFSIAEQLKQDAEGEKKTLVKPVDGAALKALVAEKDTLVIFYAPWCPHCQTYVLHDEEGNAEKAPVELLRQELQKMDGPEVVKFDVDADSIPKEYTVKHIPTMYFATKAGAKVMYPGDPSDFQAIKDFVTNGHKAEVKESKSPIMTVLAKLHAAAAAKLSMKRETSA